MNLQQYSSSVSPRCMAFARYLVPNLKPPCMISSQGPLTALMNQDQIPSQHLVRGTMIATRAHASSLASSSVASAAAGDTSTFIAIVIGWVILAGSCFRSLPQILKILKAKSTEGLSLTSLVVETCCFTSSMAYNINHKYPLNTWGDSIPCWLQNLVIIAFILRSSSISPLVIALSATLFVAISGILFCGFVPLEVLAWMQVPNIAIQSLGVKMPQIYLNWTRGSSGVLSRFTCLLNVLGNLARVFTTFIITKDLLLLVSVSIQLALNSILLIQTLMSHRKEQ